MVDKATSVVILALVPRHKQKPALAPDNTLTPEIAEVLGTPDLSMTNRTALAVLAAGGTVPDAADAAGVSPALLRARLKNPTSLLRRAFLEVCERGGLTDDALVQVFKGALSAKVVVTSARELGAVETEIPDHNIRLRAASEVAQLRGYYPEKDDHKALVQVNIVSPLFDGRVAGPAISGKYTIVAKEKQDGVCEGDLD